MERTYRKFRARARVVASDEAVSKGIEPAGTQGIVLKCGYELVTVQVAGRRHRLDDDPINRVDDYHVQYWEPAATGSGARR